MADFIPRLPEGQMWCRECGYNMHAGAICTRCGWCDSAPALGPAVPRDELAGMLRPFVSSGGGEWEMADELLNSLAVHHLPEGSDTP